MQHQIAYILICAATTSWVILLGPPSFPSLVLSTTILIAILGVPHGGLDHWTGRRLLQPVLKRRWWIVFFPTYLLAGVFVAAAWLLIPSIAIVLFFLLSAWHFGREESEPDDSLMQSFLRFPLTRHLQAIATGGFVIWIPAVARPLEMKALLSQIIPLADAIAVDRILCATQTIALIFLPLGIFQTCRRMTSKKEFLLGGVVISTAVLAIATPILMSFSIYFCLWHSVLGLKRLKQCERLTFAPFLLAILPLSFLAVAMIAAFRLFASFSFESSFFLSSSSALQTLFIGLSAIAVPHIVLHEVVDFGHYCGQAKEVLG